MIRVSLKKKKSGETSNKDLQHKAGHFVSETKLVGKNFHYILENVIEY